jgi:hypothetical protein
VAEVSEAAVVGAAGDSAVLVAGLSVAVVRAEVINQFQQKLT